MLEQAPLRSLLKRRYNYKWIFCVIGLIQKLEQARLFCIPRCDWHTQITSSNKKRVCSKHAQALAGAHWAY